MKTQDDPIENGTTIASTQWSCGSWASVIEFEGRFYVADDTGVTEYDDAASAIEGARIGRDTYDKITYTYVASEYAHLC